MSIPITSHFSTDTIARMTAKVKENNANGVTTTMDELKEAALNYSTIGRILGKIYDAVAFWQSEENSYATHYKNEDDAKTRDVSKFYSTVSLTNPKDPSRHTIKFVNVGSAEVVAVKFICKDKDLYCEINKKHYFLESNFDLKDLINGLKKEAQHGL